MGIPLHISSISSQLTQIEFKSLDPNGSFHAFESLSAEEVTQSVLWVLAAPDYMEVNDIVLRPTKEGTSQLENVK